MAATTLTNGTANGNTNGAKPLLRGVYQLGEELGKGAFGRVYKCLNIKTGELLAVKQTNKTLISEESMKALRMELEMMQRLRHPNIVSFLDFYETPDHIYFIMEYVEGGSLHEIMRKFGVIKDESLIIIFLHQIVRGVLYLHKQGIVHRDIKGANILITKEGMCKLADFGSSTYASIREKAQTNSGSQSLAGSPFWMAPEIIAGEEPSCKSDVWSIGCVAIELLTGKPPYWSLGVDLCLFRMSSDPHPPLNFECSENLKDFLLKCFSKDVTTRMSAEDLMLHPWLTSLWGPSPSSTPAEPEVHKDKKKKLKSSLATFFGSPSNHSNFPAAGMISPRGRSLSVALPSSVELSPKTKNPREKENKEGIKEVKEAKEPKEPLKDSKEAKEAKIDQTIGEWLGKSQKEMTKRTKKASVIDPPENLAEFAVAIPDNVVSTAAQRSLSSGNLKEKKKLEKLEKLEKEKRIKKNKKQTSFNSASSPTILIPTPSNSSTSAASSTASTPMASPRLHEPRPHEMLKSVYKMQQLLADAPVEWKGRVEFGEELNSLLIFLRGQVGLGAGLISVMAPQSSTTAFVNQSGIGLALSLGSGTLPITTPTPTPPSSQPSPNTSDTNLRAVFNNTTAVKS